MNSNWNDLMNFISIILVVTGLALIIKHHEDAHEGNDESKSPNKSIESKKSFMITLFTFSFVAVVGLLVIAGGKINNEKLRPLKKFGNFKFILSIFFLCIASILGIVYFQKKENYYDKHHEEDSHPHHYLLYTAFVFSALFFIFLIYGSFTTRCCTLIP